MKGLRIGLIVILSVIMLGLCSALVWGIKNGGNAVLFSDTADAATRLVLDEEAPLDGISRIEILYGENNNDVLIHEGEGNILRIKEYVNYEAPAREITDVRINGSTLEIRGKRRNTRYFFGIDNHYGHTEIWLPVSYQNALTVQTVSGDISTDMDIALQEAVILDTTSGDITMKSVSGASVELTTVSGNLKVDSLCATDEAETISVITTSGDVQVRELAGNTAIKTTSGYIDVKTITGTFEGSSTSGDITVGKVEKDAKVSAISGTIRIGGGGGTRNISTSSGDIWIEGIADSFDVRTTSGEVGMTAEKGEGYIETSSGDVRLSLPELTGDLDIRTTSGSVEIAFPAETAMTFEADTSSGNIDTYFDDSLEYSKKGDRADGAVGSADAAHEVRVETSSGDIIVKKL